MFLSNLLKTIANKNRLRFSTASLIRVDASYIIPKRITHTHTYMHVRRLSASTYKIKFRIVFHIPWTRLMRSIFRPCAVGSLSRIPRHDARRNCNAQKLSPRASIYRFAHVQRTSPRGVAVDISRLQSRWRRWRKKKRKEKNNKESTGNASIRYARSTDKNARVPARVRLIVIAEIRDAKNTSSRRHSLASAREFRRDLSSN